MIKIRITAKVARRLKIPLEKQSTNSSINSLGDWYVNLLIVKRRHLLLAVSEKTLLPVLMQAKDLKSFPTRLPGALDEVLRSIEIPDVEIEREIFQMKNWVIAKTASRQVLGSMNDFANMLEAHIDDSISLKKLSLRLGTTPCGPLNMNTPIHVTADLFGVKPPGHLFSFDFYSSESKPKLRLIKNE